MVIGERSTFYSIGYLTGGIKSVQMTDFTPHFKVMGRPLRMKSKHSSTYISVLIILSNSYVCIMRVALAVFFRDMPFQRVPVGRVAHKKNRAKMSRSRLTMGKDAVISCISRFLHPRQIIALTFPMLTRTSDLRICVFVDER